MTSIISMNNGQCQTILPMRMSVSRMMMHANDHTPYTSPLPRNRTTIIATNTVIADGMISACDMLSHDVHHDSTTAITVRIPLNPMTPLANMLPALCVDLTRL